MIPSLKELIIFSDGSASQFKQRYLFKNLTFLAKQFSINLSWNFFASNHGKVKIYILDIMISKQLALVLFFFILVIVAQAGNEPDTDLNNNIQKSGIVSTVNRQQRWIAECQALQAHLKITNNALPKVVESLFFALAPTSYLQLLHVALLQIFRHFT
ncbi:unnamed protein product [Rotaria sordida]|uniref:Uncharacterized protein n=1 Tax=Rotaria sordida TaxID=392033 RepID=A0A814GP29_9BILA|nr:unnamed protein product [Rotaria sordida]